MINTYILKKFEKLKNNLSLKNVEYFTVEDINILLKIFKKKYSNIEVINLGKDVIGFVINNEKNLIILEKI